MKGNGRTPPNAKPERNALIEALHLEDCLSMAKIAARCGLTRERVRQILRQRGVTRKETRAVARIRSVTRWECEVCGKKEWRTGQSTKALTCSTTCLSAHLSEVRPLSRDDLLDELLGLALELGHTPSTRDMTEKGAYTHPTYFRRFGSWRAACKEAGLEPNDRGGAPGNHRPLPPDLAPYAQTNGATP